MKTLHTNDWTPSKSKEQGGKVLDYFVQRFITDRDEAIARRKKIMKEEVKQATHGRKLALGSNKLKDLLN